MTVPPRQRRHRVVIVGHVTESHLPTAVDEFQDRVARVRRTSRDDMRIGMDVAIAGTADAAGIDDQPAVGEPDRTGEMRVPAQDQRLLDACRELLDPVARRVATDAGVHDADILVVAMGADYDMAATPGFGEGGHEYYTLAGAERLRDALGEFRGGRVLVSVLGQPFKCPPAPFEGSFLLHELFTSKGIRDAVEMATTFPMQRPVPVTGDVSQMFRDALAQRLVEELSEHLVTGIDPAPADG